MRLEYRDPTTAYAILDLADGTQRRLQVRGQSLRNAERAVAAEQELAQLRVELAERAEQAKRPSLPERPAARAGADMGLLTHSDVVSKHYAGMQRLTTRVQHPEL